MNTNLISNISDFVQEQESKERKMFGTTEAKMREAFKGQIALVGRDMFVASILSDIQECIEHDDLECARQFANRAKFVLFEM
jgi:ribosomal protein L16/L10AE